MPQVNRRSSLGHWYAPVLAPEYPRDPPEPHGCTLFERCKGCPYTIMIGGRQTYLFEDEDQWFVEAKNLHI